MSDCTQKLTIIMKCDEEEISVTYTKPEGIHSDDMFWMWFMNVWPMLGMDFVKEGIKSNE